jgi:hypothetical protein
VIRPAKIIAVIFCVLAAVALIALIGINLYLQSGDVQQRIRLATEDAVGAPVSVRSTLYTPWSGLTMSGLTIPPWIQPAPNMFEAAKFSLRFELMPLFNRRFVVREVNLDEPVFALRQREDGAWSTAPPADALKPTPVAPPVTAESPARYATPGAPREVEDLPQVITGRPPAMPYVVELRKLHVRNGTLLLVDNRGRPMVVLRDVQVTTDMKSMTSGSGEFSVAKMEFGGALKPRNLRGKFSFAGRTLNVTDILCDLAEGTLSAQLDVIGIDGPASSFEFLLEAKDISIPALLVDATGEAVGASGTAVGTLQLRGNPSRAESLTGRGLVELDGARMQPVDFIRQIGTMLSIDELQMLDLTEAGAEFSIANKKVNIERLLLRSDNLMIAAEGPIRFDGKMDLDARLLLNEKLQRQLRPLLSNNFTASENADFQQVTFSVKGRMSRPETNLVERMTGIQLGSFGGLIRGLFKTPKRPQPADE